ncbi:hypothetical protein C4D60_Mb00t19740 [Musa balbisiana]|uniref:Ribosomal protein S11 n=1 Tax=Musa balbisiana TaxID=52838 RepID=A0A4S8I2M9_MUSBA|nr:hypothetical protein C4D60_Mb00t19740 [Musa balbisiana]
MDVNTKRNYSRSSKFQQYHRCSESWFPWASAVSFRFKGTIRGSTLSAQAAALNAIRTVVNQGMQRAEVMIKGPGLGRGCSITTIRRSGILLSFVRDVTPMPHNGCRPPKKRRVVEIRKNRFQEK